MSRKTTASRPQRAASAAKTTGKTASATKRTSRTGTSRRTPAKTASPARKAKAKAPPRRSAKVTNRDLSPLEVLTRAETDVAAAIETLNQHMNAALVTFTELASAHHGRGKAVIRTAPLDRATATFQRLIAEVVDEQLAEMLGPLIDLRNQLAQRGGDHPPGQNADTDLYQHARQVLDHVLTTAGARSYEARPGEMFDPLIHLAVGETNDGHLADGVVAEALVPGFRSARGKVLAPAKVKVNRR